MKREQAAGENSSGFTNEQSLQGELAYFHPGVCRTNIFTRFICMCLEFITEKSLKQKPHLVL